MLDDLQEHHKDKINGHDFHKLKQSYKDKITEFIIKIEDQTVKTKLGVQKAIVNVFDISNIIIRKLLSHLNIGPIDDALQNHNTSNNILQKEFEEELIFEYIYVCTEYDICRSRESFSDFLVEFLKIILKTDNRKVKQASDALTEVLKDVDFAKIMDWESYKIFKVLIAKMEFMDELGTRAILTILKSIIANRNQPIILYGTEDQALVNKTVIFHDILNDFDKALPGNNENTGEWDHLTKSLSSWVIGKNNNILNITKNLFKNIEKGIDKMMEEEAETMRKNIRLILIND
ncbi:unnamed protein product [Parnassius apollo]|uniref:(apollo) hypothetical protein n=1 Tax=Parnassius apollo TaxID=110799 RepID=A0A8S3WDE9_PARAO|nr:unnamed protein product [Parnassius apollo]